MSMEDINFQTIEDAQNQIRQLCNELAGLESYRNTIVKEGLSKDIGIGLEHLSPGTLNLNVNMLTQSPSQTKVNVALEAIEWKMLLTRLGIFVAIAGVIVMILSWIFGDRSANKAYGASIGNATKKIEEEIAEEVKIVNEKIDKVEDAPDIFKVLESLHIEHNSSYLTDSVIKYIPKELVENKDKYGLKQLLKTITLIERATPAKHIKNLREVKVLLIKRCLKHRLNTDIAAFGYMLHDLPYMIPNHDVPPPFTEDLHGYKYTVSELSRAIELLKTSFNELATAYKSNDTSVTNGVKSGIARNIPTVLDHVLGDGVTNERCFVFTNGGVDGAAKDSMKKYNFYHAPTYMKEIMRLRTANQLTYENMVCSEDEHRWWGADNFDKCVNNIKLTFIGERDEQQSVVDTAFLESFIDNLIRLIGDENYRKEFIEGSDHRLNELNNILNTKTGKELIDEAKELQDKLKKYQDVVEDDRKEQRANVFDMEVAYKPGNHVDSYVIASRKNSSDSTVNLGNLFIDILKGVQAQCKGIANLKAVNKNIERRYTALRTVILD